MKSLPRSNGGGHKRLNKLVSIRILPLFFLVIGGIVFFGVGRSYALFENRLTAKNISLQVGNLSYEMSFKVLAEEEKVIEYTVQSLDEIDSKYQLYYKSKNNLEQVTIGYAAWSKSLPYGDIESGKEKVVTILVHNKSREDIFITIGTRGGFSYNRIEDIELKADETAIKNMISSCQTHPVLGDNSGANVPELAKGMIPVVYSEKEKSWEVANTLNDWYDYDQQEWANAVTVKEDGTRPREYYQCAPIGTNIPLEDINTMWVWVPRFSYTIKGSYGKQEAGRTTTPSQALPGEIDVKFISKETIENGSAQYTDSVNETWRTPDGFTFDHKQLSGFWVGKFELTGNATGSCENESCDISNLTIKPNELSKTNLDVTGFFFTVRSMQKSKNPYGFDETSQNTINIHMFKNSEWGVVAYLSQSKYGKYGNNLYQGAEKQVKINNCSQYKTGIGATTQNEASSATSCTNPENLYDGKYGMSASTTGNITGIYDMSGGSFDYVMGILADENGFPRCGNNPWGSRFTGKKCNDSGVCIDFEGIPFPDVKYYDLYKTSNPALACDGVCFGHALSETSGWYGNGVAFANSNIPWFYRGGENLNKNSGVFFYSGAHGSGSNNRSTHAILSVF